MFDKLQAWLNVHPLTKAALAAFTGGGAGIVSSYLVGVVNANGTFTGDGLRRTAVMAVSSGVIAVIHMYWTVPVSSK